MENLFRLMLSRPAVAQDPQNPSVELAQETPYQGALRDAVASGRGRAGIEAAGTAYVAGSDFIGDPAVNPFSRQLATLAAVLDQLENRDHLTPKDLSDAVRTAFGQDLHHVVAGDGFGPVRARLRDSVLAVKMLQDTAPPTDRGADPAVAHHGGDRACQRRPALSLLGRAVAGLVPPVAEAALRTGADLPAIHR